MLEFRLYLQISLFAIGIMVIRFDSCLNHVSTNDSLLLFFSPRVIIGICVYVCVYVWVCPGSPLSIGTFTDLDAVQRARVAEDKCARAQERAALLAQGNDELADRLQRVVQVGR